VAWTYEITDGSPLNNCWKAFCELAQALRERIIATNGDDTEAPEYELPDGSTAKAIAITDYEGTRIRSYLLRDNAEILRDAVFETYTLHTSKWCNSDASFVYLTVQEVIEEISAETDWIALAYYMQADFWTQIQDVMAHLRYLVYWVGSNSATSPNGIDSGGAGTSPIFVDLAWADFSSNYVEVSGGNRSGAVGDNAEVTPSPWRVAVPSSVSYTTKSTDCVNLESLWDNLSGTVLESAWCLYTDVYVASGSVVTRTLTTAYDTYSLSETGTLGNTGHHYVYYNADLGGDKIDFGTISLSPAEPTRANFDSVPSASHPGTCTGSVAAQPVLVLVLTGNTFDKTRVCYYLTDIASVVSYI